LDAVTALTQMLPGKELPRTKGPFSKEAQERVIAKFVRAVQVAREDAAAAEVKESEILRQRVAELEAEIARLKTELEVPTLVYSVPCPP